MFVQERAQDLAAAFDQDIGHSTTPKLFEQRHDRHTTRSGKHHNFTAEIAKPRASERSAESVTATKTGPLAGGLDQAAREWQARCAIEHDPQWACAGPGGRAVSSGSSATTVPIPTTMASILPRSSWTRRLDDSDEIQRLSPVLAAVLPSKRHRPFGDDKREARRKLASDRGRSGIGQPLLRSRDCTARPAASSNAKPRPSTWGNGSRIAATTRTIPAAKNRRRCTGASCRSGSRARA